MFKKQEIELEHRWKGYLKSMRWKMNKEDLDKILKEHIATQVKALDKILKEHIATQVKATGKSPEDISREITDAENVLRRCVNEVSQAMFKGNLGKPRGLNAVAFSLGLILAVLDRNMRVFLSSVKESGVKIDKDNFEEIERTLKQYTEEMRVFVK